MADDGTPTSDAAAKAAPFTDRQARILEGPVGKALFHLSWPMSLGLFSVIAFNVVDTLYIGRLGTQQLAAIGYCFPVIFGLSAIAIGMGNGATSVVARRLGAGEIQNARELIMNTIVFVTLCALVLAGLMVFLSRPVFSLLGVSDELMPFVHQYMDVWYAGLPFLIVPIVLNGLIRATGDAFYPSVLMIIAAIVNAVLSPVLVFGLLGAPALGMAGAAWATILARGVITVLYFVYLARLRLMAFSWSALSHFVDCVRDLMRFGAPAFAAQLVSPVAGAVITRLLSDQGTEAVAAFTIGARIETLALVPFFALQTGIGPFVGQNVGAGNIDRLRRAERSVLWFCFGWGSLASFILLVFGGSLAGLFTQDSTVLALADRYLAFIAFGFWGAGLMVVAVGIFNPLGYPNLGMALSALRYLALYVGIAVSASILLTGQNAVYGIYASASLSYAIAGGISLFFVHRLLDKPRDISDRDKAAPRKIVGHDDMRPVRHPSESFKDGEAPTDQTEVSREPPKVP